MRQGDRKKYKSRGDGGGGKEEDKERVERERSRRSWLAILHSGLPAGCGPKLFTVYIFLGKKGINGQKFLLFYWLNDSLISIAN